MGGPRICPEIDRWSSVAPVNAPIRDVRPVWSNAWRVASLRRAAFSIRTRAESSYIFGAVTIMPFPEASLIAVISSSKAFALGGLFSLIVCAMPELLQISNNANAVNDLKLNRDFLVLDSALARLIKVNLSINRPQFLICLL